MRIIVTSLLLLGAASCLVGAWVSNARWTRQLNAWGRDLHCRRWPDETNNRYYQRLRARIGYR